MKVVISVNPMKNFNVCLVGLGKLLEEAECKKEKEIFGDNHTIWRNIDIVRKEINYAKNCDPWYDGYNKMYTIVVSPRKGSLLTLDEIKEIVFLYGKVKSYQY